MHCGCLGVRFWDLLMLQEAVETSLEGAEAAGPMFTGPSSILWVVVCACLLIFALFIIVIIRGRVAQSGKKSTAENETLFKPAGDQADLSFGDETHEPEALSDKNLSDEENSGHTDEAAHQSDDEAHTTPLEQEEDTSLTQTASEQDDVQGEDAIDSSDAIKDDKPEAAPKKNRFAGLFSKKSQDQKSQKAAKAEQDQDKEPDGGAEHAPNDETQTYAEPFAQTDTQTVDNDPPQEDAPTPLRTHNASAFFQHNVEDVEAEVIIEHNEAPQSPELEKVVTDPEEQSQEAQTDQDIALQQETLNEPVTQAAPETNDIMSSATAAFSQQHPAPELQEEPAPEAENAFLAAVPTTAIKQAPIKEETEDLLRQLTAEKEQLAAERAKVQADREAEFERRKQDAAIAQRLRNIEIAELERTLSQQLTKAIDARFSVLAERIEGQITSQMGSLRKTDESAVASATSAFSNETNKLAARFDEHRSTVSAALIALTDRVAQSVSESNQSAPDLSGLYEEISSLRASMREALAERAAMPAASATAMAISSSTIAAPAAQLSDILLNALPPDQYELNAKLNSATGVTTADALILLPALKAPIAVDARFPMDAFYAYQKAAASGEDIEKAQKTFRRAVLRHIVTVAENLVVHDETAPSAFMFAPSEALFTTLHQQFSDVVHDGYRARVWIASPTSLMASLHTMSAALRDQSSISLKTGHGASTSDTDLGAVSEPSAASDDASDFLFTDEQIERVAPFLEEGHKEAMKPDAAHAPYEDLTGQAQKASDNKTDSEPADTNEDKTPSPLR